METPEHGYQNRYSRGLFFGRARHRLVHADALEILAGRLLPGRPPAGGSGPSGQHGRHQFFGLHGVRHLGRRLPGRLELFPDHGLWHRLHGPELLGHRPQGLADRPRARPHHALRARAVALRQPGVVRLVRPGHDPVHGSLPGAPAHRGRLCPGGAAGPPLFLRQRPGHGGHRPLHAARRDACGGLDGSLPRAADAGDAGGRRRDRRGPSRRLHRGQPESPGLETRTVFEARRNEPVSPGDLVQLHDVMVFLRPHVPPAVPAFFRSPR